MRTEFLCISVLRVASGPRVKLASCKSALNSPVVCSTDRSKALVPVLVLSSGHPKSPCKVSKGSDKNCGRS